MTVSFEGKTVIVTGAGSGVGRATAQHLAELGAEVMMVDRNEAALQAACEDCSQDGRIQRFSCDVSAKFGVNNLLAATLDAFNKIDALITTPSDFERSDLLTLGLEDLERVMSANVSSAFLLSQAVAKKMIARAEEREDKNAGAIVNVSSLSGRLATPQIAAYGISCAAIDQLTRTMAATLSPYGVRVNGVAPGGVMTENLISALQDEPGLRGKLENRTPLGRIGETAEVAEAAVFLASDAASFITGEVMVVDGGRAVLDPLAERGC